MTQPYRPTPPAHLRPPTREWWASVVADFALEPHHVRLLSLAATAWDRAEQARELVERHGLTFDDRFGAPRSRPEIAVERDSRLAFARLLRELQLDIDTPDEVRPARLSGKGPHNG